MADALLPPEFSDLEPFAKEWCLASEPERYAKRLASTAETRSRAVGGWAVLVVRRLQKPVGPEGIEIIGRLIELAMIDAQDTVQNLRRLQTQLEEARQ
jgi:hypothetical protein